MVRYLDSSVFLFAYLKPKKRLSQKEAKAKEKAKEILRRIDKGENVLTSVVHLSEVINIVEARTGLSKSLELLESLLAMANLEIDEVKREDYEESLVIAERYKVSPNDALASIICKRKGIKEIYSFDKHFDNIPFVKRIID